MATELIVGKTSDGCVDGDTYLSRLFSLISNFLPNPFTELELIALTKEKEKDLLISLSQICNLIRRWTDELRQDSSSSSDSQSSDSGCGDDKFLTKMVENLVSLLNARSQYVRHMVGNIFLAFSEFLLSYGDCWDRFIHLLCVCFELAMSNILQPQSLMTEADDSKSVVSNMKLVLNNSTWNGVAEILRILRGLIKHMKGTDDDELVGVLLNSLSICLTNVPWDLLNENHDNTHIRTKVGGFNGEAAAKILFMGALVQLLCSIVDLIGCTDGAGSNHKSAILCETSDLVPRLLLWCHVEEWSHIIPYFRHKILMLMVKLSFHMQLGCSILILWLQLLHEHYQDLLSSSISQFACGQNDTLEGSPFLLSLDDPEICHMSSYHLQRKAIFLFLRCFLSLICLTKTDDYQCTCARSSSFTVSDLSTVKECFAKKKGLLQFYEWLQVQFPSLVTENEIRLDKCIKFASSFIKFYMQEDDMLFEVLLQMLTIPSWAERLFSKERRACHVTEEDILFHVSNLFNPLLLFHVFLAELQYDHQLLLDYLISKDMGGKCAEYLLRCLRIVCDSWELFLKYSVGEGLVCQSIRGCKKRRASPDNSSVGQIDTPLESGHNKIQSECNGGINFFGSECLQLEGARGCLLSLKSALRKLHRRKLFPYNPEVLMRRLTKFEELCDRPV